MSEYIDRAALKQELAPYEENDFSQQMDVILAIVDAQPAADVVEVRHGRWFFTEYEFFTCSVCGESYYNGAESTAQAESYLNSGHTYKYCPNCGARMDKEDEHGTD